MRNLKESIIDCNKELSPNESNSFTIAGFEEYKSHIDNYIISLYDESIKISQREAQERISLEHVKKAANYLAKVTTKKGLKLKETIGGILVGAVFSNLFSIYVYDVKYTTLGFVMMIVTAAIGTSLLTLGLITEE